MEISIVMPTFNRRDTVTRSLTTLFDQDVPSSQYEMVVVVDGSTDGTVEALARLCPPCAFTVVEQENRGAGAARNTGVRAARSDLILFLDDDMLCDPGLIAAHRAAHRAGAKVVAFGAILLCEEGPPSLAAECFKREIGGFHLARRDDPSLEWDARYCVFSNTSLPKALFEDAGGFDEEFRLREDLELGLRLFGRGVTPHYLDRAVVRQYYTKSTADLIREAGQFALGDVQIRRKHPQLARMQQHNWFPDEPRWKRGVRRAAARVPALPDLLLAPICAAGEHFIQVPALREAGVRALQMRRRIHWLNRVMQLERE